MPNAIDYALLIGEMEGVSSKLKQFGTPEEVVYIEELKKKYYKVYFNLLREERKES